MDATDNTADGDLDPAATDDRQDYDQTEWHIEGSGFFEGGYSQAEVPWGVDTRIRIDCDGSDVFLSARCEIDDVRLDAGGKLTADQAEDLGYTLVAMATDIRKEREQ